MYIIKTLTNIVNIVKLLSKRIFLNINPNTTED